MDHLKPLGIHRWVPSTRSFEEGTTTGRRAAITTVGGVHFQWPWVFHQGSSAGTSVPSA